MCIRDRHYCFSFVLDPVAWHSVSKKIVVPDDIKGMKIRPAQGTIAAWVTQLGGTNVQSSAPEVRDILAKGVADAVTFPWGSMLLFGIDKVTKYDMDEPLGSVTFQWLMNPAAVSYTHLDVYKRQATPSTSRPGSRRGPRTIACRW